MSSRVARALLALPLIIGVVDLAHAQRRRPTQLVQSSQTRLPGLQFYGEPYSWRTPMRAGREQNYVRRSSSRERFSNVVPVERITPAIYSGDHDAVAPMLPPLTDQSEPQERQERLERKRPSGPSPHKATRVIPLFSTPDDQR